VGISVVLDDDGSEYVRPISLTDAEQVNNIEDIMKPSGLVPDGFFDVGQMELSPQRWTDKIGLFGLISPFLTG
jgi:hypothetical protein